MKLNWQRMFGTALHCHFLQRLARGSLQMELVILAPLSEGFERRPVRDIHRVSFAPLRRIVQTNQPVFFKPIQSSGHNLSHRADACCQLLQSKSQIDMDTCRTSIRLRRRRQQKTLLNAGRHREGTTRL